MENDESPIGGPLELPGEQPANNQPNKQARNFGLKKIIIVLIAVIVIGALGFGIFKLVHKPKTKKAVTQPTNTSSNTTTASHELVGSDIPAVTSLKDLNNPSLGVELKYPDGWTVTQTDKVSDGIKIESPNFNYTNTEAEGTAVTGNFRVYIRKGSREVDGKYIGRGVATDSSQTLAYAAPLATQRKTTYLSTFGLDKPDDFAFFLIAGNFNLKKGDTLGPNYGKEADAILVMGGYSAKELKDDFATYQVSLDNYDKTNAYKQAIDIVKSLKLQ